MMVLVSGATATVKRHGDSPYLGQLFCPDHRGREPIMRWAADNGAYSGFDPEGFTQMLERLEPYRASCIFVAVPDVVGDWKATRALWDEWAPRIGYPLAFVLQDGQPSERVPWDELAAVFVGGTTVWKLSDEARALCREAKDRGKWVHVGRVNTWRRIEYAAAIGADSFDGTQFSWWADHHIPRALRALGGQHRQSMLGEEIG